MHSWIKNIPGLLFLFVIGLLSKHLGALIPHVSYLIVAIGIGMVASNIFSLPGFIKTGILNCHQELLKTGIVILGARIVIADLLRVGPIMLLMVIVFLVLSALIVEYVSSRLKLESTLGSCLASGTSVCGVSAVVATAGGIGASGKATAYAIATVLLFDVITVFLYPALGLIFSIPAEVFGPWAGISMFSTGTAVAAGFAHSDHAGQLATMAKMARNVFIGAWALFYTIYYTRKGAAASMVENKALYLWEKFPKFVLGFMLMMVIANTGFISTEEASSLRNMYNWLFMMAFVGLGYDINFKEMKKTGLKPFLAVMISFTIISLLSLTLSFIIFR